MCRCLFEKEFLVSSLDTKVIVIFFASIVVSRLKMSKFLVSL